MKALESELGCTLFIRTNKGVTLTREGEALYAHISLAFEHIQTGEEEISANKGLQKGIVSIGATEISLRCFLLPILNEYRNKYPGISIKISSLSSSQALSALKAGIVDFAIVTTPIQKDSELHEVKVKEFREVAICGEVLKSKLGSAVFELKELTQYPIVSFEKGRSTHTFYTELFAKHSVNFSPDIEAATADQIIPIVKHNLGIGFIPEQFLHDEPNGIYKLNLKDQIPAREICVVTRKGHSPSLAVRELKKMMLEE
jgi:DNA-binding transcriptional LysR family regulator